MPPLHTLWRLQRVPAPATLLLATLLLLTLWLVLLAVVLLVLVLLLLTLGLVVLFLLLQAAGLLGHLLRRRARGLQPALPGLRRGRESPAPAPTSLCLPLRAPANPAASLPRPPSSLGGVPMAHCCYAAIFTALSLSSVPPALFSGVVVFRWRTLLCFCCVPIPPSSLVCCCVPMAQPLQPLLLTALLRTQVRGEGPGEGLQSRWGREPAPAQAALVGAGRPRLGRSARSPGLLHGLLP